VVAVICVATIVLLDLASRCRVCGAVAVARSRRAIDAASTPALSPLYAMRTMQVEAMGRLEAILGRAALETLDTARRGIEGPAESFTSSCPL
jgi:hypothetical protein